MIRITSGRFKGREVRTPSGVETRPTLAKMRQALFNVLQMEIVDAKVLDLFAGSGSLGFEALSRDAKSVHFVESSSKVCQVIRANAEQFQVTDQIQIIPSTLELAIKQLKGQHFDVILADPPYSGGFEEKLLQIPWGEQEILNQGGLLSIEWSPLESKAYHRSELPETVGQLVKIREKKYGDSCLTLYRLQKNS